LASGREPGLGETGLGASLEKAVFVTDFEKRIKTDICDFRQWQQMAAFGNILAAEGHRIGREWRLGWQQMAADWQLNGNNWQQNGSGVRNVGRGHLSD
jgi:hypothetical protein